MEVNRRAVTPSRVTSSFHMDAGRTQMLWSPYSAWYTTMGSRVSEWVAVYSTRYSFPLKWR